MQRAGPEAPVRPYACVCVGGGPRLWESQLQADVGRVPPCLPHPQMGLRGEKPPAHPFPG